MLGLLFPGLKEEDLGECCYALLDCAFRSTLVRLNVTQRLVLLASGKGAQDVSLMHQTATANRVLTPAR